MAFLEEVERLTDGSVTIDLANEWRAGEPDQEQGMLEDIQAGELDMGWVGARALEGVGVTSFQALLAPLLVDSYELEAAVFEEGIAEQMLADITEQMLADGEEAGLTGIAVLPGPLRKMMGIAQPFTTTADFAGQVVGYSGGPLAERSLEALGAQPQLVAESTPLEGLDALDYHLAAIYGNFYFEQADYVTGNLNVWPRPVVVVMNADVFATLSADLQAALREAGVAASGGALEASSAGEAEAGSGLCTEGMTVATATEADLDELQAAFAPVYSDLEESPSTLAYLDAIRALKEELGAPAAGVTCPDAVAGAGGDDVLVGTWTASGVTCAQQEAAMQRAGFTAEELAADWPERCAYTEFALAFEDGRLQLYIQGERDFNDEYEVVDDHSFLLGGEGGIPFEYAVDGDQLTIDFVGAGVDLPLGELIALTMIFESAPFVRTP